MYGSPVMPLQMLPMRPQAVPVAPPVPAPPAPAPRPLVWQSGQALPIKVRGVAPEPTPARFVLPSPEALGVSASRVLTPAPSLDWQAIQARLARLGTLRYRREALAGGGIRVTLLLPSADPARGQPVAGEGATEADAALAALRRAESGRRN